VSFLLKEVAEEPPEGVGLNGADVVVSSMLPFLVRLIVADD